MFLNWNRLQGVKLVVGATCALSLSTVAQAGFTTISSGITLGEIGHSDILNGIYGGSFVMDGLNFSNGSITAVRMHDFDNGDGYSGSLNLLSTAGAGMNDQIWNDGIAIMGTRARYSSYDQSFGIYEGSSDPTTGFTGGALITADSNPFLGSGSSYGPTTITGDWRWGREGTTAQSSYMGDNSDGLDHMVTYRITGDGLISLGYEADAVVWLLFWDDEASETADRDFNDLVVEIVAVAIPIPIPAPVALAGLGLLAVVLGRRRMFKHLS